MWTELPPEKRAHPPTQDAAWYGSRPRPRPHCTRRGPSSRERGTAAPPLFSAHVYCGHGRPSQLLLSSCFNMQSRQKCNKNVLAAKTIVFHFRHHVPGSCNSVSTRRGTDTQTHRRTHRRPRPLYVSRRLRLTRNVIIISWKRCTTVMLLLQIASDIE